ncbi:LysR family transcriptional regulator [Leucobacter sp. G161]|uniref:LysR family transcriptional regulator n=1 Tax=Leucobacter sp. G161 TaxID=663704 RepID=UPI00073BFDAE|nr:LysR family transcriptional regulator [Leucobacter sp. G161]KUF06138.1 hypothetical protein AUL38_14740 [Leucobacter sp. G161]
MRSATLRQLEYFVAACETGTVSEAAVRCSASQASVSAALNELERGLGVQLLFRIPAKGVALTRVGEQALPIAKRILRDSEQLSALAWEEEHDVAGPLRVAATFALSPRVLPAIAEGFANRYPRVDLHLFDGLASEVQQQLADRLVDCALLYRRQLEQDFSVTSIRSVQPFAVLSEHHPLAGSPEISLSQLSQERLILVDPRGSSDVIQRLLKSAGVVPRIGASFENPETVRAMVARGLGYSVFSGRRKGTDSFDGRGIVFVPIADSVVPNEVVLARSAGTVPNARLAALEAFLLEPDVMSEFG